MQKFETLKTISGEEIKVVPNYKERTFTIQTETARYRTNKMSSEEFDSCLNNTGNDWNQFLKTDDYYKV